MTSSPELLFEFDLAAELHKTHHELWADMAPGELAFWRARNEIQLERQQARAHSAAD